MTDADTKLQEWVKKFILKTFYRNGSPYSNTNLTYFAGCRKYGFKSFDFPHFRLEELSASTLNSDGHVYRDNPGIQVEYLKVRPPQRYYELSGDDFYLEVAIELECTHSRIDTGQGYEQTISKIIDCHIVLFDYYGDPTKIRHILTYIIMETA
jgi:hypothetical protein